MNRSVVRSTLFVGLLLALSCSTTGTSCAGCAAPIPGGFPADQRQSNAITAKVTRNGLSFFETRVNDIIGTVAATGLDFQVPCTDVTQNIANPTCSLFCIGPSTFTVPVYACDVNQSESCDAGDQNPGPNDPQAATSPPMKTCQAKAQVKTLSITPSQASPTSPVVVNVDLEVRVNTGAIPVSVDIPLCNNIICDIEYDSNAASPAEIPFKVPLTLTLDPNYGNVLSFNVGTIDVTNVFDTGDLSIGKDPNSGFCSYGCDILSFDFVKNLLLNFLKGTINSTIADAVDKFRCRPCEAVTNNCPQNSTCDTTQGVCYVDRNNRVCPPAEIGLEGRVGAGQFLASFGGPEDALLDLYAVAGGKNPDGSMSTSVQNGGIVIGLMGGTEAAVRDPDGNVRAGNGVAAACVPVRQWTKPPDATPIDFDAEAQAQGEDDYQLGLALSGNFLNKSTFDAFQAGLLCLNVDSHVSTFLSTSLFTTFLPSLGELTHGQDAPMLIALRPKQAPTITIGKGTTTTDASGNVVPDDPLLTISMKSLNIDFYAFLEERYVRLFSLKTDLTLPLSLKFDPVTNTVQPVLANLSSAVSNIDAQNSELLSEDPQIVADLLDAIIGLVQPILATALGPIQLPTFSGFALKIRGAEGAVPAIAPATGYQHLALFADLDLAAHPMVAAVDTEAKLVTSYVPAKTELVGPNRRHPVATVEVEGRGLTPTTFQGYEYSYRVDGGLWSPWMRHSRIEVKAPVLELPGRHDIDFISRDIGDETSEDRTPARVTFLVDYDPPMVRLSLDPETRQVMTVAHDAVSRDDELAFRYRTSGGAWTSASGPEAFSMSELGDNPSLEVEVTDRAGHVGHAVFGVPASDVGLAATPKSHDSDAMGGCAQTPAMAFALLGALLLLWRRRRTE